MTELVEKVKAALLTVRIPIEMEDAPEEWYEEQYATAAIEAMRPEIEREIADWLRQPRVGMGYVGRCIADVIEAGEYRSKP